MNDEANAYLAGEPITDKPGTEIDSDGEIYVIAPEGSPFDVIDPLSDVGVDQGWALTEYDYAIIAPTPTGREPMAEANAALARATDLHVTAANTVAAELIRSRFPTAVVAFTRSDDDDGDDACTHLHSVNGAGGVELWAFGDEPIDGVDDVLDQADIGSSMIHLGKHVSLLKPESDLGLIIYLGDDGQKERLVDEATNDEQQTLATPVC